MAILKDTLIQGSCRVIGDAYMNLVTASSFKKEGSNSSYVLLGDGSHKLITELSVGGINGYTFKTLSTASDSGWTTGTTDSKIIPTMSFIAYWNGAYSGTSSNLAYCNKGAFGTVVTHAHGDYLTSVGFSNGKFTWKKGASDQTAFNIEYVESSKAGLFILGQDNVLVKNSYNTTGSNTFNPTVGSFAKEGFWSLGSAGNNNDYWFIFGSNTNYSNTNNETYKVKIKGPTSTELNANTSKTLAFTSDIPTLGGLMGSSSIGTSSKPIYWTGSAFSDITHTIESDVPLNAVFTDTWKAANTSQEGYVPQLALNSTNTIATQSSEYVLTYISGTETAPVWRKLPANAFKNDNTWKLASSSQEGYVPAATAGKFLHANSSGVLEWVNDNNTWRAANTSQNGYVPQLVADGGTIASSDTAYVLAYKSGVSGTTTPTWILLPANAYNNTWTAMTGATSSANGTVGYINSAPPKDGYNTKFWRADGSWQVPTYTAAVRDPDYHTAQSRRTSMNLTFNDGALRYFCETSSCTTGYPLGSTGDRMDAHIIHMAWDNGSWDALMALPNSNSHSMQWRVRANKDNWENWRIVLDASNYTSYVVPLSGGTMTGPLTIPSLSVTGAATFSLAINGDILGNAATSSRLLNARTISLTGNTTGSGTFDGSGNLSISTTTSKITINTPATTDDSLYNLVFHSGNDLYTSPAKVGRKTGKITCGDISCGAITTSGNITIPNNYLFACKDSGGSGRSVLSLNGSNLLTIGYGTSAQGYNTELNGHNIYFKTGTGHTTAVRISNSQKIILVGDKSTDDGTTAALHLNNSNIIGINSLYFSDYCDDAKEGINFKRSSGDKVDTLYVLDGDIKFMYNRTLNSTDGNDEVILYVNKPIFTYSLTNEVYPCITNFNHDLIAMILNTGNKITYNILPWVYNDHAYQRAYPTASLFNSSTLCEVKLSDIGKKITIWHPCRSGYVWVAFNVVYVNIAFLAYTSAGNAYWDFPSNNSDGWMIYQIPDNENASFQLVDIQKPSGDTVPTLYFIRYGNALLLT